MSRQTRSTGASEAPESGASVRARLAAIARETALEVPGVVRADRDHLGAYLTRSTGGELLDGVNASAAADGGYAVSLRLVAALVPLHPLGKLIAERVRSAAVEAGLGTELESLSIQFTDVEDEAAI